MTKYSTLIETHEKYQHIFTVIREVTLINKNKKILKLKSKPTIDMKTYTCLTRQHKFRRTYQIFNAKINGKEFEIQNFLTELPLNIDLGLKETLIGKFQEDEKSKFQSEQPENKNSVLQNIIAGPIGLMRNVRIEEEKNIGNEKNAFNEKFEKINDIVINYEEKDQINVNEKQILKKELMNLKLHKVVKQKTSKKGVKTKIITNPELELNI